MTGFCTCIDSMRAGGDIGRAASLIEWAVHDVCGMKEQMHRYLKTITTATRKAA